MIDCLLIGFNDQDFTTYRNHVAAGGTGTGAYQDVRLAYVEHEGRPYRALDLLSRIRGGQRPDGQPAYHNADFLWPVITYLGSYLSRRGFSFGYANLYQREKEKLARLLADGAHTVAITTTLYVSPEPIEEIVAFVRARAPDTTIVVGGPYIGNLATAMRGPGLETHLHRLGADVYVMAREGEFALAEIVRSVRAGGDLRGVANLVFRDGERWVYTPRAAESNSLADEPVDYQLFPVSAFNEFVTTRTAKSCPFSCSFCGFPQRAGKYVYLDQRHVERELDRIAEIPSVNTISFIDDTFNVPKVRFREILQMMIDKRYGFRWNCYYRSDHGDRRTIELMREAGCEGVFLGIESGSDEQLARMNKTARRKHYLSALRDLRDVGIGTYASLIIGFPGETAATVAQTESLLAEAPPDFFRAQLWYCDPVTPIWQQRERYGIKGRGFVWAHDTMSAAEACRHIERMFLTIDDPIWMPQHGFEQWSTFYLQRRGMSMTDIRSYLGAFNAAVRDQIRHPGLDRVAPELLERMVEASGSLEPAGSWDPAGAC